MTYSIESSWLKIVDLIFSSNTKTQCGSLARSVRYKIRIKRLVFFGKVGSLKPTECNTDLQVNNLSSIDRNTLVVVGTVFKCFKSSDKILLDKGRKFCSVNLLIVLFAHASFNYIKHLEADILSFLIIIKP